MKVVFKIAVTFVITFLVMAWTINRMELYWCKQDLYNLWGEFDSSEVIEQTENLTVYYAFRDGDAYVVTIHNGELDSSVQIN